MKTTRTTQAKPQSTANATTTSVDCEDSAPERTTGAPTAHHRRTRATLEPPNFPRQSFAASAMPPSRVPWPCLDGHVFAFGANVPIGGPVVPRLWPQGPDAQNGRRIGP